MSESVAGGPNTSPSDGHDFPYQLDLEVVRASKLAIADFTASDPYTVVMLDGKYDEDTKRISGGKAIGKTKTIKKSLSPEWCQEMDTINLYHCQHTLNFVVWDEDDDGDDDFLGRCSFDISSLVLQNSIDQYVTKQICIEDSPNKKTESTLVIRVRLRKFDKIISLLPDANPNSPVDHGNNSKLLDFSLSKPAVDVLVDFASDSIRHEDARDSFYDLLNFTHHGINKSSKWDQTKNVLRNSNPSTSSQILAPCNSFRICDDASSQVVSRRPIRYCTATGEGERCNPLVLNDKSILFHMNDGLTHVISFPDVGTIWKWTRCLQFAFDMMYDRVVNEHLPGYINNINEFIYASNLELCIQQPRSSTSASSSSSSSSNSLFITHTNLMLKMSSTAITASNQNCSIMLENVRYFTLPFQFMPVGNASIQMEVEYFANNNVPDHFDLDTKRHSLDPHLSDNCSGDIQKRKRSKCCICPTFNCVSTPEETNFVDDMVGVMGDAIEGVGDKLQGTYFVIWGQDQKHVSYEKSGLFPVWRESTYFDFNAKIDVDLSFSKERNNHGFYVLVYQGMKGLSKKALLGVSFVPLWDLIGRSKSIPRGLPYDFGSVRNAGRIKIPIRLDNKINFGVQIQKVNVFIDKNLPSKPRLLDESVSIQCSYADCNGAKTGSYALTLNLVFKSNEVVSVESCDKKEEVSRHAYVLSNPNPSSDGFDIEIGAMDGLDLADFVKLDFHFDHVTKKSERRASDTLGSTIQEMGSTFVKGVAEGLGFDNSLGSAFIPISAFNDYAKDITVPLIIYQKYAESVKKAADKDIAVIDNFCIGEMKVKISRSISQFLEPSESPRNSTNKSSDSLLSGNSHLKMSDAEPTSHDEKKSVTHNTDDQRHLLIRYDMSTISASSAMWPCGLLNSSPLSKTLFSESLLISPVFEGFMLKHHENSFLYYGNRLQSHSDATATPKSRSKKLKDEITVEVFENEQLALFWSKKNLAHIEIQPFTDKYRAKVVYNYGAIEDLYDAYPPVGYKWVDDWEVEVVNSLSSVASSKGKRRKAKYTTDEFGWVYSLNFTSLYQVISNKGSPSGSNSSKPNSTDHVRTRKWTRRAKLATDGNENPLERNLHTMFSGDATPNEPQFDWRQDVLRRSAEDSSINQSILELHEEKASPTSSFLVPYTKVSDIDVLSDTLLCIRLKDMQRPFFTPSTKKIDWRPCELDLYVSRCDAKALKTLIEDRIYLFNKREMMKRSIDDVLYEVESKKSYFRFKSEAIVPPKTPLNFVSSPSANLRRFPSQSVLSEDSMSASGSQVSLSPRFSRPSSVDIRSEVSDSRPMSPYVSADMRQGSSGFSKRSLTSQESAEYYEANQQEDDGEWSTAVVLFNEIDKEFSEIDQELLDNPLAPLDQNTIFARDSRRYYLLKKRFQLKLYIAILLGLGIRNEHKFKLERLNSLMHNDVIASANVNEDDSQGNSSAKHIKELEYLTKIGEKRILECGLCGWDYQEALPGVLTAILNHYIFEIASLLGCYFDGSSKSKIKGWENKIQLLVGFMKGNDKLQNALTTTLRFYKLKVNKPPVLSIFLNPDDLISWYSKCLSDEMTSYMDKAMSVWKLNDPTGTGKNYMYPLPWYPFAPTAEMTYYFSRVIQDAMQPLSGYMRYARVEDLGSPSFESIIKTFDVKLGLSYINAIQYLSKSYMREIGQVDWSNPNLEYNSKGIVLRKYASEEEERDSMDRKLDERSDFVSMICNDTLEFVKNKSISKPADKNEFVRELFSDSADSDGSSRDRHEHFTQLHHSANISRAALNKALADEEARISLKQRLVERVSATYVDFLSCHIYAVDMLVLLTLSRARLVSIKEEPSHKDIFTSKSNLFDDWSSSDTISFNNIDPSWDLETEDLDEVRDSYLSKLSNNCLRKYFDICFGFMEETINSVRFVESFLLYFDLCLSRFCSMMLSLVIYSVNAGICWPSYRCAVKSCGDEPDYSFRFYYDVQLLAERSKRLYEKVFSFFSNSNPVTKAEVEQKESTELLLESWRKEFLEPTVTLMQNLAIIVKMSSLDRRFLTLSTYFTEVGHLDFHESSHLMNAVRLCVLVRADRSLYFSDKTVHELKSLVYAESGPIHITGCKWLKESGKEHRRSILENLGLKKQQGTDNSSSGGGGGGGGNLTDYDKVTDKDDILDGDVIQELIRSIDAKLSPSYVQHLQNSPQKSKDEELAYIGYQIDEKGYRSMAHVIINFSEDKTAENDRGIVINIEKAKLCRKWDKRKPFFRRAFELFHNEVPLRRGFEKLFRQPYLERPVVEHSATYNHRLNSADADSLQLQLPTSAKVSGPVNKSTTLEISDMEVFDLVVERKFFNNIVGKSYVYLEFSVQNQRTGKDSMLRSANEPRSTHVSWSRRNLRNMCQFLVPLESYFDGFSITCKLFVPNTFGKDELLGSLQIPFYPLENDGIKEKKLDYDPKYAKKVTDASNIDTNVKFRFKITEDEANEENPVISTL